MQAKEQAPELVKLLKDPDAIVRGSAAATIRNMGPLPIGIVRDLSEIYYSEHALQGEIRFLCYYLTAGDAKVKLVVHRIMLEQGAKPTRLLSVDSARETLRAFRELMPSRRIDSGFSDDADKQILQIAGDWKGKWSPSGDYALFSSLSQKMGKDGAVALWAKFEVPWWQTALEKLWQFLAVQVAFWILLLCAYPKSTQVQAFLSGTAGRESSLGWDMLTFV